MSTTKSVEFRDLPTPEQIRAHGDGGLWEGVSEELRGSTWFKLWDKPRDNSWWDSSCVGGEGFCVHGGPWTAMCGKPNAKSFRPLNPDGSPRDWAEIDAIVAANAQVAQVAQAAKAIITEQGNRVQPTDTHAVARAEDGGTCTSTSVTTHHIWSPQGVCHIKSLTYNDQLEPAVMSDRIVGQTLGAYTVTTNLNGDITQLPLVFDLIVETTQNDKTHTDSPCERGLHLAVPAAGSAARMRG